MTTNAKLRPWFRHQDGWWYVTRRVNGKRVQTKLAQGLDNEAAAFQSFYELMAAEGRLDPAASPLISFNEVCQRFLVWSKRENEPSTTSWYHRFLGDFDDHFDGPVQSIRKQHVEGWLGKHPDWSQSTRRQAITCVKRVVNWGYEEGLLAEIPVAIRGLKRPPMDRRETIVDDTIHQKIVEATDDAFGRFVAGLRGTGARPDELRRVTAADVDLDAGVWLLGKHKTGKKTGKPRIIYLTEAMRETTRELVQQHPDGPLFRNSRGKPWTANAVRCRMRRLREKLKLPDGVVAYAYRHTFATEGLAGGVGIAEMAELLGHSDTKMLSAHYAHLDKKVQQMRKAAETAAN